jgi:hypothetical protein
LYPRDVVSGTTRTAHFRSPHFEHLMRFTTSSSRATHLEIAARVFGYAWRTWPQAQLNTQVLTELVGEFFSTRNSRMDRRLYIHPVQR